MSDVTDIYRDMLRQHVIPEHVVMLAQGHIADLRKLSSTDEIEKAIVDLQNFVTEVSEGSNGEAASDV